MAGAGNWCTIESDPGVFSELVRKIGVSGVQLEELYTLDEAEYSRHGKIFGLVFLFKWQQGDMTGQPIQHTVDGLFFARQVIQNACATQALLSVLMNRPDIDIGEELSSFKEFTSQFDPETLGYTLSNQETVRTVHNSFSRQETFSMERDGDEDEDAFHFISYVPFKGRLYELDGLQGGPIDHGPCDAEAWMAAVVPVIQQRIQKYASSEIRFNLMAVVGDKLDSASDKKTLLEAQLMSLDEGSAEAAGFRAEVAECEASIAGEQAKREQFRVENIRRRHNYIPFFVAALRALARKDKLAPLLQGAKTKATERMAEAIAAKKAGKK